MLSKYQTGLEPSHKSVAAWVALFRHITSGLPTTRELGQPLSNAAQCGGMMSSGVCLRLGCWGIRDEGVVLYEYGLGRSSCWRRTLKE